jgi:hypothetical protein
VKAVMLGVVASIEHFQCAGQRYVPMRQSWSTKLSVIALCKIEIQIIIDSGAVAL